MKGKKRKVKGKIQKKIEKKVYADIQFALYIVQ